MDTPYYEFLRTSPETVLNTEYLRTQPLQGLFGALEMFLLGKFLWEKSSPLYFNLSSFKMNVFVLKVQVTLADSLGISRAMAGRYYKFVLKGKIFFEH